MIPTTGQKSTGETTLGGYINPIEIDSDSQNTKLNKGIEPKKKVSSASQSVVNNILLASGVRVNQNEKDVEKNKLKRKGISVFTKTKRQNLGIDVVEKIFNQILFQQPDLRENNSGSVKKINCIFDWIKTNKKSFIINEITSRSIEDRILSFEKNFCDKIWFKNCSYTEINCYQDVVKEAVSKLLEEQESKKSLVLNHSASKENKRKDKDVIHVESLKQDNKINEAEKNIENNGDKNLDIKKSNKNQTVIPIISKKQAGPVIVESIQVIGKQTNLEIVESNQVIGKQSNPVIVESNQVIGKQSNPVIVESIQVIGKQTNLEIVESNQVNDEKTDDFELLVNDIYNRNFGLLKKLDEKDEKIKKLSSEILKKDDDLKKQSEQIIILKKKISVLENLFNQRKTQELIYINSLNKINNQIVNKKNN